MFTIFDVVVVVTIGTTLLINVAFLLNEGARTRRLDSFGLVSGAFSTGSGAFSTGSGAFSTGSGAGLFVFPFLKNRN